MDEVKVSESISIPLSELDIRAVRAQGAGGQNVNKVATAIHLRFDISNSPSLPEHIRARLLASGEERNRQAALQRLIDLVREAGKTKKPRKPTRPGKAARQKRLDAKSRRGELKKTRGKPTDG